jgi:hypothetical protein
MADNVLRIGRDPVPPNHGLTKEQRDVFYALGKNRDMWKRRAKELESAQARAERLCDRVAQLYLTAFSDDMQATLAVVGIRSAGDFAAALADMQDGQIELLISMFAARAALGRSA